MPFARVIDINLIGIFNVLRLGAERIVKIGPIGPDGEEHGVIINNNASVAAFGGQIGQVTYSAYKWGLMARNLTNRTGPG
nr:hypothetical protein [Mycobacterium lepromatosis]